MDVRAIQQQQSHTATPPAGAGQSARGADAGFRDILAGKLGRSPDAVRFSRHAAQRIESRNLSLSDEQLDRIRESVDKAAAKGAKESVFVMDSLALVVSIDNRTVITCVDRQDMKQSIFTNVDSVAFL